MLELRNSSGALIASNDNWQDTQKAQIIASGLAPTNARESAILLRCPLALTLRLFVAPMARAA